MSQNVGNYSVSIKSFFGSLKQNSEKNMLDIEKKKKKTLKPIINSMFENFSELSDDSFWKSIFNNCARGKFPRGFTYKNNLITHKKGSKMTRLELSNNIPESYLATLDFFQRLGGIYSLQDRAKMKKIEEDKLLNKLEDIEELTWKDIKTEKLKDIIITEFIDDLSKKMNFNDEEKKELTTTIKKGFFLKIFSNIEMNNGKIVNIDGLKFNEKTNEFEINSKYYKKTERQYNGLGIEKIKQKNEIDFLESWEKYLTNLENKRINKKNTYSSSYSTTNKESDDLTQSSFL